ncbi:MAG: 2-isopropylmalate synthase [Betaproteobacteria bacterium]|nr:2-isopropylmalate synthase [Betaproteobacteria bacterium]
MLNDPSQKYAPFPPVDLPDRQWPGRRLAAPPVWMSTDLRDGNQALFEPMDRRRKMRLFQLLCEVGFKEIEVGFPSASQTDFDFVRELVEGGKVPEDVTIEVLTPAREPLIVRTLESLRGARRAIVHLYNATARPFRDMVFGLSREGVTDLAVEAVRRIRRWTDERRETQWTLQYSPEAFSATELDFSLAICDAVSAAWGAAPGREMILNLPATVEMATPNVFADQIEWMHRRLARRESLILSVHPHNDRGSAVAAAELALMAGAERVEGCLFGNGERTGNVDLVTLALNLYSQGVAPGLDFSDIGRIARVVEACTGLPVHPRHPYVGDLVFTAFSGSHQDAIKKGLARQVHGGPWNVPYLPIDPADLGRSYDALIRLNSQSGKGGIAYLLESRYGLVLPRRLLIEFSRHVQRHMDRLGTEIGAQALWTLFTEAYLGEDGGVRYVAHQLFDAAQGQGIRLGVAQDGEIRWAAGEGNGPIDAAVAALRTLGIEIRLLSFQERALRAASRGSAAQACAFVEAERDGAGVACFGVGLDPNIVTASLKALFSAVNRVNGERAAPAHEAARSRGGEWLAGQGVAYSGGEA